MSTATVSIVSACPAELESELAIAANDTKPSEVRVNGLCLTALQPDQDLPETGLWRLDGNDETWSIVAYAAQHWEVLDIYTCLERGESLAGSPTLDLIVTPAAGGWIVTQADPSGEAELRLHVSAEGTSVWHSRAAACAAAHRVTQQHRQAQG